MSPKPRLLNMAAKPRPLELVLYAPSPGRDLSHALSTVSPFPPPDVSYKPRPQASFPPAVFVRPQSAPLWAEAFTTARGCGAAGMFGAAEEDDADFLAPATG